MLEVGSLEALTPELAQAAGELLASTGESNAVDATVVASAAKRGDIVAMADEGDLRELAKLVRNVVIQPIR